MNKWMGMSKIKAVGDLRHALEDSDNEYFRHWHFQVELESSDVVIHVSPGVNELANHISPSLVEELVIAGDYISVARELDPFLHVFFSCDILHEEVPLQGYMRASERSFSQHFSNLVMLDLTTSWPL